MANPAPEYSECQHEHELLAYKTASNGSRMYTYQCQFPLCYSGAMRKIDPTTLDIKISYDFTLSKRQVVVNGHHAKHYKSSCRDLYIYKNIIIKIEDKWSYGHMGQCRNEVFLWKKIKVEDKKYFATILASHIERSKDKTSWVAQRRYHTRPGRVSKEHTDIIYKLAEKYKLKDLEFFPPWNWGMTKEGPVIFDYGL